MCLNGSNRNRSQSWEAPRARSCGRRQVVSDRDLNDRSLTRGVFMEVSLRTMFAGRQPPRRWGLADAQPRSNVRQRERTMKEATEREWSDDEVHDRITKRAARWRRRRGSSYGRGMR